MAVSTKKGAKHAKAKKKAKKKRKSDSGASTDITGSLKAVADVGTVKVPQLASKGRARIQRARTAEREQRRLHGTHCSDGILRDWCLNKLSEMQNG